MKDFFSKSMLGQLTTALQAPGHCDEPTSNDALRGYMQCNFLKGQREAWEIILYLFMGQFFCIVILVIVIYKKGRRAVSRFNFNNQLNNLQIGVNSPRVELGNATRTARSRTRSSGIADRIRSLEASTNIRDRETIDF